MIMNYPISPPLVSGQGTTTSSWSDAMNSKKIIGKKMPGKKIMRIK